MAHCWFEPPLQSQISSWVPLVVLNPGSSRHRPDTGFTSIPFTGSHCWLAPPLQVQSSTSVPLAVPAPVMSMHEPSNVNWASDDALPRWFDLAREFTERWAHQQHIRDAVGAPGTHDRLLPEVLRTFVWAFPHQYRPEAPQGTAVHLDFGTGGDWTLTRDAGTWVLDEGTAAHPAAGLRMPAQLAWRQLTGLPVPASQYVTTGNDSLARPLLAVRGIIA